MQVLMSACASGNHSTWGTLDGVQWMLCHTGFVWFFLFILHKPLSCTRENTHTELTRAAHPLLSPALCPQVPGAAREQKSQCSRAWLWPGDGKIQVQGKIWSKRDHLKMNSWRTMQLGSRGMPCLLVSATAGISAGSTTKICPLIAYVTGIYQSQPVPGCWRPRSKSCTLQPDHRGLCSVPGAGWASAVPCPQLLQTGVTQDRSSDGQCWDLSGFLPISLGLFY